MAFRPGARLGPYEILAPLGAGGMGEVYKARDTRLGREVAVKVLPSEFAADPERLRRFEQEAKATAALDHPNILAVFDIGAYEGTPYIVEQLLEGETLRDRLRGDPLPPAKAVDWGVQIAQGLAAAHEKGIVHRDLKPENLWLTKDARIKILDFGLAKLLEHGAPFEGGGSPESVTRDVPTETGRVMGTIGHMAPEQARGEPTDARSDVFSFGVVLYEMLSGKRPFERPSTADAFVALLKEDPPPLPKGLPSPLGRIVRRCLEKRPQDRYASGGEISLALETLSETSLRHSGPSAFLPPASREWPVRWLLSLAFLVLLGTSVAGLLIWKPWASRGHQGTTALAGRAVRMAVLPFANLSGDPEQDYLSDGLTQEMISQLSCLHPESLSVIARTSVMRYKKTDTPIDRIGKELGVDYVLEGSTRREGSRIRVTAELVKVKDQTQLWAQTYEREFSGILPLESDVARNVANALALKLLPTEQAQLAGAHPVNPEAYEAYLKGSQYWTRFTAADLDASERYFNLALATDPTFAPAHAGLAVVWVCRQQMGFAPPSEAAPKAKAEARRALELDDTVALAHFALAAVLTWTDWDWAAAGREWVRAIELDPGDAWTRASYSHFLMIVGRPDEAMDQIEAALKADPFNVIPRIFYGVDLVFLRQYEEALAAFREALRMQPGGPAALASISPTSARLGMQKEAIEAAKEYLVVVYQEHRAKQACDEGYAQGGYREAMKRVAESLAARFSTSYVLPTDVAWFYIEAGDKTRAVDWLEKGYEVRDPVMPYLGWGFYDSLRSEPRFQALMRKMNLPQSEPPTSIKRAGGAP